MHTNIFAADIWQYLLSLSSVIVILAIIGFNETAGSVDIRTRLKYSNTSSVTASLRVDTITVWVVEEGLKVRFRDVLGKSIPAVLRDEKKSSKMDFKFLQKFSRLTHGCAVHRL